MGYVSDFNLTEGYYYWDLCLGKYVKKSYKMGWTRHVFFSVQKRNGKLKEKRKGKEKKRKEKKRKEKEKEKEKKKKEKKKEKKRKEKPNQKKMADEENEAEEILGEFEYLRYLPGWFLLFVVLSVLLVI